MSHWICKICGLRHERIGLLKRCPSCGVTEQVTAHDAVTASDEALLDAVRDLEERKALLSVEELFLEVNRELNRLLAVLRSEQARRFEVFVGARPDEIPEAPAAPVHAVQEHVDHTGPTAACTQQLLVATRAPSGTFVRGTSKQKVLGEGGVVNQIGHIEPPSPTNARGRLVGSSVRPEPSVRPKRGEGISVSITVRAAKGAQAVAAGVHPNQKRVVTPGSRRAQFSTIPWLEAFLQCLRHKRVDQAWDEVPDECLALFVEELPSLLNTLSSLDAKLRACLAFAWREDLVRNASDESLAVALRVLEQDRRDGAGATVLRDELARRFQVMLGMAESGKLGTVWKSLDAPTA